MANPMMERMMYDRAMRNRNYRARGRDGRNPYGSAGGYVVSRNMDRDDERRGYDRNDERRNYDRDDYRRNYDRDDERRGYDRDDYRRSYDRNYDQNYDGIEQYYNSNDYGSNDYEYDGHYNTGYTRGLYGYYGDTPFEVNRMFSPEMMYHDRRDYRDYMDYDSDGEYLKKDTVQKWTKKLLEEIDEKDKDLFTKDKIMKKTEEMGIKFEKITPEEFYLTVLMMYTDYCKTFGNAVDTYIRMAKDWLMDDDVKKKYGKKLAAYYHHVVKAD